MWLSDVSIRRPVFAVMLIAALVALGFISWGRLGVDLFPSVEFPIVTVTTVLEGATPETVETEVTEIIEESVNTISGIEELTSQSSEGLSQVFVRFKLEEDVDVKAQDVRDKVALARRDLPDDIEPPIVEKMDPDAAPILAVMVSGSLSPRELTAFADDEVKERLERLPGVGSVARVGGREREVRIWLDAYRLRGYGLSAEDVIRAIQTEHAELPGGRMETGQRSSEYIFKTTGQVETVEEFADLVIVHRDGGPIRVGDVARVEDGLEDERSYAELNGVPGVSLLIRRQSGQNTVEVARAVRDEVELIRQSAPQGISLTTAQDVSRFIESSIEDVTLDMMLGGFLAVLVTLAFLRNLSATIIVAVAIPTSIVGSFFFFYLFGFSVNMLTMMGLSISIGILIDDAVVVLENIYRHIEAGEPPMKAAVAATAEIGPAVIVATLAIGAVFVPIAFMGDIVGRFFNEYGLTVVFAVFMSLLVALTLTPMLSSRLLRRVKSHGRVYILLERSLLFLEGLYVGLLGRALRHRALVMALAIVATWGGVQLAGLVPMEFTSSTDRSEFQAKVELPLGTGVAETKRVAREVSQALTAMDEVEFAFATIGAGAQGRVNEADFYVKLTPKRDRATRQSVVMDRARKVVARSAPTAKSTNTTEISWVAGGGFTAFELEFAILGADLERLEAISHALMREMRASDTFVDINSSYDAGKPEVRATIDRRRAAALGINVRQLASTLRTLVGGVTVATYEEGGERYDVRVRLEESQRDDLAELGLLQVRAGDGRLADLENLAHLEVSTSPAQIDRQNRSRQVVIYANTPPGVALGTATDVLEEIVARVGLPDGYAGELRGSAERMKDSARAVGFAFLLALLSLYMILASQFNSFVQPLVVMLSAPLSFVGAFAALVMAGETLSLFGQIGILILMGLVMKNGILLVDYANLRRDAGRSPMQAMLEAGPVRLRPILMTTVSTVAGMLPVAFSRSDGAEFRNSMGILVIGGLLSSMLLTLFVVPTFYTLIGDFKEGLRERVLPKLKGAFRPLLARNGRA